MLALGAFAAAARGLRWRRFSAVWRPAFLAAFAAAADSFADFLAAFLAAFAAAADSFADFLAAFLAAFSALSAAFLAAFRSFLPTLGPPADAPGAVPATPVVTSVSPASGITLLLAECGRLRRGALRGTVCRRRRRRAGGSGVLTTR